MRTSTHRSLLALLLLACAAPGALPAQAVAAASRTDPAAAELRGQIEAVNRRMEQAFARGDLRAVAAFYADDAVMMGPGGERVRGRAAIDRYWAGIRNPKRWKLDVFDVGGSATEAYQLGRSSLVSLHEGREHTSVTDFIVIWKRDSGGEWRIAVDMWPGGGSGGGS
jgi:uncharacterized protein (TIGR02246 family)